MPGTERFSDLLDSLYEAAGSESGWGAFFAKLARIVPFSVATFSLFDAQNSNYALQIGEGICPEARELYNQRYGAIDEWYRRAQFVVREGWVSDGRSLCSNGDLIRTEFYNDFIRKFGWLHECAAVIEMRASRMSVMTMMRDSHRPEFSNAEIETLRTLVPHLKRALALRRRMVDLQFCNQAKTWILDRVPFGAVLLSAAGRVLWANRHAAELAREGIIRLSQSGLHAICCREDAQLQALIRSAIAPLAPESGGGALMLEGIQNRRIAVLVTAVRMEIGGIAPAVAIFLADDGTRSGPRAELLRRLFKLTPAEGRLADRLADGVSLDDAAGLLGITVGTARTQLKSVFLKTETSRQAELVRLLVLLSAHPTTSTSTAPEVQLAPRGR
jgi:DNA-binding CsgD family transcriptional regulator